MKPARLATLDPASVQPVLQQDARGLSVGDVVAAGERLHLIRAVQAQPPRLRCEPLPGHRGGLDNAMRAFRRFTAHHVGSVEVMPQTEAPGVVYVLGDLVDVSYEARRGGKVNTYLHRFKKSSRPRLAVSHDGNQLYILGGGYRVTSHGIVG